MNKYTVVTWVILVLTGLACVAGVIVGLVLSFVDGWWGNHFPVVWSSGLGGVIVLQAAAALRKPTICSGSPWRQGVWMAYTLWVTVASICIIAGYATIPRPERFMGLWAVTWVSSTGIILACTTMPIKGKDVPPPTAKVPTRSPWGWFVVFCGYSSLFWVVVLGFFLALQAVWLSADQMRFPPPGVWHKIAYGGTKYRPKLHIRCVSPANSTGSLYILEAGAGAPAASLFGLQDELKLLGRRSCAYDRLGFGWSDPAIYPTGHLSTTKALKSLLTGLNITGPYILAGHSAGGQLALTYAAMFPSEVKGLALLDSYSETSIAYDMDKVSNVTTQDEKTTLQVHKPHYQHTLQIINLMRSVTPLGWPRFIHKAPSSYKYQKMLLAQYGSNKEWQGQWAAFRSQDDLDEELSAMAGRTFWYGRGWPSFGAMPVLVLPARDSIESAMKQHAKLDCDFREKSCQEAVLAVAGKPYGPKLQLAYAATLSSNATLTVVDGKHDYPWAMAKVLAELLESKFRGL